MNTQNRVVPSEVWMCKILAAVLISLAAAQLSMAQQVQPSVVPQPLPTPATGTAYEGPQPSTFNESYIFAVGDHLHITVDPASELSGDKVISVDGTLEMPLLGSIRAAGLTPVQLRTELALRLTKYVANPIVLISPGQFAFRRVALLGYVGRPGYYDYHDGMRLSELLTLAGGLESYANGGAVKILRDYNGQTSVLTADMDSFFEGHYEKDIVLLPKDIVTIPKTKLFGGAQWMGANIMPWASVVTMVIALLIYTK